MISPFFMENSVLKFLQKREMLGLKLENTFKL